LGALYFLILAKLFLLTDFRLREPIEYCMRKIPNRINHEEDTRKLRKPKACATKYLTFKNYWSKDIPSSSM
jgi:hypothetical protein